MLLAEPNTPLYTRIHLYAYYDCNSVSLYLFIDTERERGERDRFSYLQTVTDYRTPFNRKKLVKLLARIDKKRKKKNREDALNNDI